MEAPADGQYGIVTVRTQIQLYQFGQVTDFLWHLTLDPESAQVQICHPSVRMHLYTWLIAPQVRILIEVPVASGVVSLTPVGPVLAAESIPDLFQGIIVYKIRI